MVSQSRLFLLGVGSAELKERMFKHEFYVAVGRQVLK